MNFTDLYIYSPTQMTREFYFNIGGERIAIYLFLFLSVAYLSYSIYKKISLWRKGKKALRTNEPIKRILAVVKYSVFQIKVLREKKAGLIHSAIFFGFLGLFAVTALLTIQEDIAWPLFDVRFLSGNLYLFWSLFADIVGALVFIGLLIAIVRRYIIKPDGLDTKGADNFLIISLMVLIVTGFAAEALRIAITGFPSFEIWSPVGYGLAYLVSGIDIAVLRNIHYANWWVHMVGSFMFIGLLGTGKIGHAVVSTLNIYFMELENENAETKFTAAIIKPEEFESAESFGVSQVEEYTWKQLMDSDACTRCGRCQDNCPAYLTEKPLSPKKFITDIKENMNERIPKIFKANEPSALETTPLIDGSVSADEFWSCTNCGACMEVCPVCIEHVQKIIDLRRHKVLMEGDMAPELQTTFQNLETNYNPYGFAFGERGAWLQSIELKNLNVNLMSENSDVDYLYFVGSSASFDKRNQKIATAFLKIMKQAGFSVGILGPEEADSGDAAMRAGNEYLFHALAIQNLETFKTYGVKRIVCTCPHDYNIIKKEYKKLSQAALGSDGEITPYEFEVYHHSEIIADLIKNNMITLENRLNETVTYHDSCFLGRYNELYNEPRFILNSIPELKLVEMNRHKEKSFCCGAGGGRMFIEEHLGTRINQFRTEDAKNTEAATVCTACPFCMTMISDGITELEYDNIKVLDIAELVYDAMEKTSLQ